MTTEQNKAIVRRFYEAFSANDQTTLKEILAPDLVAYSHGTPEPMNRETHLQRINNWNLAFETRYKVEEQIAEGDLVATSVSMHATHNRGEYLGHSPSGKTSVSNSLTLEKIKDGKIVERRVSADWYGIMKQLGLAP